MQQSRPLALIAMYPRVWEIRSLSYFAPQKKLENIQALEILIKAISSNA